MSKTTSETAKNLEKMREELVHSAQQDSRVEEGMRIYAQAARLVPRITVINTGRVYYSTSAN